MPFQPFTNPTTTTRQLCLQPTCTPGRSHSQCKLRHHLGIESEKVGSTSSFAESHRHFRCQRQLQHQCLYFHNHHDHRHHVNVVDQNKQGDSRFHSSSTYTNAGFASITTVTAFVVSSRNFRLRHRRHSGRRQNNTCFHVAIERKDYIASRYLSKRMNDDDYYYGNSDKNSSMHFLKDGGEMLWFTVSLGTAAASVIFSHSTTAALLFCFLYGLFAYGLGKPYVLQDYLDDARVQDKTDDDNDDFPPPVFLISYFAALLSAGILTPIGTSTLTSQSASSLASPLSMLHVANNSGNDGGLVLSLTLVGFGVLVGSIIVGPRLVNDDRSQDTGRVYSKKQREVSTGDVIPKNGDEVEENDNDVFLEAINERERRLFHRWDQKLEQQVNVNDDSAGR